MSMSKNCKDKIVKALTGKTSSLTIASDCYIALLKSEPSLDGYNEVTGAGYKRMLIGNHQSTASQAIGAINDAGTAVNTSTIFFPEAEEDWGTITHFALFNTQIGGEAHLWGALTAPVDIFTGYVPLFKEGALSITLT